MTTTRIKAKEPSTKAKKRAGATKAKRATKTKKDDAPPPKKKAKKNNHPNGCKQLILNMLLSRYKFGILSVSLDKISRECNFHPDAKMWIDTWKTLKSEGLVHKAGGGGQCSLTERGLEAAGYVEGPPPTTNEEFQAQIKSALFRKKGPQIFDLLVEHGPMSRKDLAAKVGVRHGTHTFFYALKELMDYGLVGVGSEAGSKGLLRLTKDAFLKKE